MIKEILDASRAEFAGEQEQTDFLIADVLGIYTFRRCKCVGNIKRFQNRGNEVQS